jgi:putative chitinase
MNRELFFDRIRQSPFSKNLTASQAAGVETILDALAVWPTRWVAYALATALHETARTMQPIKEYGGNAYFTRMYDVTGDRPALARRMGNTSPGDGARYCGRGYVQITWKSNYAKASTVTNVDLVGNPDAAMKPHIAAEIMRHGMERGWFTGKKMADYLSGTKTDYVNARRIINGTDKAKDIAGHAQAFEAALRAAAYGKAPEKPAVRQEQPLLAETAAKPALPEPAVVVVKNDPISTKSRTARGAGTATIGGAIVVATQTKDGAEIARSISDTLGISIAVLIGIVIIAGGAYALYARWTGGGGRFPWQKGKQS